MEWFIKKNATLPILKVKIIKDGRSSFGKSFSYLSECSVFFSMTDVETQIPKISSKIASVISETDVDGNLLEFIIYEFTKRDTGKVGRYESEILIKNTDGTTFLPITEKLYINVIDSFSLEDAEFIDNYIIEFPCCGPNKRPDTIAKYLSNQDGVKLVTNQGFSANTKYIITLNTD